MADRPLGVKPMYEREFPVLGDGPKMGRAERIKEWVYHVRHYSFGRGSTIELELEDDMIDFLSEQNWIYKRDGSLFFSRKGTEELVAWCREQIEFSQRNKET